MVEMSFERKDPSPFVIPVLCVIRPSELNQNRSDLMIEAKS